LKVLHSGVGERNHEKIKKFEQKTITTKVVHDMRDRTEMAELFDALGPDGEGVAVLGAIVEDGAVDVVEVVVLVGKLRRMPLLVTLPVDELAF